MLNTEVIKALGNATSYDVVPVSTTVTKEKVKGARVLTDGNITWHQSNEAAPVAVPYVATEIIPVRGTSVTFTTDGTATIQVLY